MLTNGVQLCANKRISSLAKNRKDTHKIAIASDKMIAKETVYHFICYRDYTKELKAMGSPRP